MMNKRLSLLIFFFSIIATAQDKKPVEIGIVTENDSYVSIFRDQYYTNGLEFFYRYLTNKTTENLNKKTVTFRIGQYMYTPKRLKATKMSQHDRPFAGYLFAETSITNFYQNESVLQLSGQIGVLGPLSKAGALQKWLHATLLLGSVLGWEYQIKNTAGVQANLFYSRKILPETFSRNIDFQFISKANVGTIWTGAQVGLMTRISIKKLLPVFNSNLFGGSLNRDASVYKSEREFYFYLNQNLNYQIYDATIQGSLFNNDSPVVFDIKPFRFVGEAGLKYRINKWNFSYSFIYKTKELINNVVTGHYYGSISVSYLN